MRERDLSILDILLKGISILTDLPIKIMQELANRNTDKDISTNPYNRVLL